MTYECHIHILLKRIGRRLDAVEVQIRILHYLLTDHTIRGGRDIPVVAVCEDGILVMGSL
jgi:hypothetical protein